ncbi:D-alanine--D-alanine ligase [Paenibacillus sp. JX-17]|uniref:D-alanine--D-alanine ligase n=1 Tax=Paenibacillus lacisoli TaxID=3064525 RepID=A0ABT9CFY2_9BACL|nr:D-alanine--D-alanine ligase [Paenibacillus sp. JX-17]MDO7906852.1 D-alanine--D-alanine ligase [Paenibacillus sp. JX-17]
MKVGVIMGGNSSERAVSLESGREIMQHLDQNKYEIMPIELGEGADWIGQVEGLDLAFLALHGKYGEDGTIQGTLETLGIPYTGSGVTSSSLCMDKHLSKKLIASEGVATPAWVLARTGEEIPFELAERLGYPLVVKPNTGGSSVGVTLASDRRQLIYAVEEAWRWDSEVLIEQYIEGEELTCGLLDGKLLPTISIRHQADFFNYDSKYVTGMAEETVAVLPAALEQAVQAAALTCYQILKCRVYARVDLMVKDGIPYVMEVNTLPGLTANSLLPKSASAAGISYPELLDAIIEISLNSGGKSGTTDDSKAGLRTQI